MRRRGLGRYYDAGDYPHSPQVGFDGSPGIDWAGLQKVILAGAAVVVVAKTTARGGRSSSAPAENVAFTASPSLGQICGWRRSRGSGRLEGSEKPLRVVGLA